MYCQHGNVVRLRLREKCKNSDEANEEANMRPHSMQGTQSLISLRPHLVPFVLTK